MGYFEIVRLVILVLFILESWAKMPDEQGDKKHVVMYHPKPHQSAIVLYGNEGSGQSEAEKETLSALATNVETVTNLVKAQSEIIENLSHQVSSASRGTENEQKFKEVFDKIANHSRLIHDMTKQLNETVKHVNELAGVWSESTVRIGKELKSLEKETDENEEDMEKIEHRIMEKIEKLQEEVKTLRVSLNYAQAEGAASKEEWPSGKYCILANGRCPQGFKRHEGHLKSLYLYSSHSQFVNDAKFGSSSIGCFGSYCGEYGNFIGALTLVTCCK